MRQNKGEKEFYLCISLSLFQNIKIAHILSQTLKYVTFCCEWLRYGQDLLSRMSHKSKHKRCDEMIMDQIRLRGSPSCCAGLPRGQPEGFFTVF